MTHENYVNCTLCPRKCGIDRTKSRGYCGQSDRVRIGRAALHMWEEPCISGDEGSGTVFFIGCTLGCVYCQNRAISRRECALGREVDSDELANIYLDLQAQRANNINLVTPTMFSPTICESIELARARALTLPILANTSGYECPEIIREIAGKIDIWLPDFKYLSPELAEKYSNAADYPEYASRALREMVRSSGECRFDERGMMERGVIVRHLLLPGQLRESIRVIEYLFAEYGNSIYYSLMCQYTPTDALERDRYPELSRRVTTYEYNKLVDHALSLGMTNAFIQEREAAKESFIPEFE